MASGIRLRLRTASPAACAFGSSARPPVGAFRSGTAAVRRVRPPARACARGRGRSRRWRSVAARVRGFSSTPRRTRASSSRRCPTGTSRRVRAPPIAGVLLTDAEIDHTAGLLLLRESATPVRVYGEAGVERALRQGYPVLSMLERYCGAEWHTLEPGRAQPLDGSSLTVEPFAVGGDAPRYLDGSGVELEASGFVFRDRAGGGVLTYVPGLARLDDDVLARFAASDLVLVDGTFWRDDELAELGISTRSARDMGHLPLSGPGGTLEALARLRATAQGARPHQQHQPDPARGLSRARGGPAGGGRSRLRWARGRAVTEGVHRRAARPGHALPQSASLPPAHGRRRADARRSSSAGSPTASTTRSASRSRTRRSCPTAPRSRSGASGSSGSSTTTARRRARAGSSRGCGSARRSASPATSSSPSAASSPACATRSTPT